MDFLKNYNGNQERTCDLQLLATESDRAKDKLALENFIKKVYAQKPA